MEELDRLSPSLQANMNRIGSSASSESSHHSSHGSSDENDLPSSTSSWSVDLIDKFGIRKILTSPFELIRTEWSLCNITDVEVSRINEIVRICSLPCIDFNSLEEIPFDKTKSLYKQWVEEWFPKTSVKELKMFSENSEDFGYFLYDAIQQLHQPRKNQEPYEIEYQVLFEKFLKLFEVKTKTQPHLPKGRATIFGQEISSSKADILCTKCDDPRRILCVCEVKRKCPSEETEYSPARKKLRSAPASTLSTVNEATDCNIRSITGLPSNVYAQHVGELLAYLESSVLNRGLLGIIIQETNVLFTFLKIKPESLEKIKRSNSPGSLKFDPAKDEEPVLFYTEQLNFLKSDDRNKIFKALLTMRLMEIRDSTSYTHCWRH